METSSRSPSFSETVPHAEIKSCCAALYEHDLVRLLLGDSFHPGGLKLTRRLGEALRLSASDRVLDLACGPGTSACCLAKTFGGRVVGVDLSEANLHRAQHRAHDEGVSHLVEFRPGDAESLPAREGEFTVVVSECSFCLFPDKRRAASEMFRVLAPHGRVGLTDLAVDPSRLPDDLRGMIAHASCLADARPVAEYRQLLTQAGFGEFFIEDHASALKELMSDVAKRLLLAQVAKGLGKLEVTFDLKEALRLVKQCTRLVEDGVATYALLTAVKR